MIFFLKTSGMETQIFKSTPSFRKVHPASRRNVAYRRMSTVSNARLACLACYSPSARARVIDAPSLFRRASRLA